MTEQSSDAPPLILWVLMLNEEHDGPVLFNIETSCAIKCFYDQILQVSLNVCEML